MKKRTFGIAFLILALSLLLTIPAAADETLSVARAEVDGWSLLHITAQYAANGYPEKLAGILPRTVTVTLSDRQTVQVPVAGAWTPDPSNTRWTNSVNLSELPAGTTDPQGILNGLSVAWQVDDYTGNFSAGSGAKIVGTPGSFSMWRYMSGTDTLELWQIPSGGGAPVLRADRNSDGYSENGNSSTYAVGAWAAGDAGEWFGLYYSSAQYWHDAYLAGACAVETNTYTVTFRPSGGVLQGPETCQTAFVDGTYRLESVPPDPVRNNYRFDGWFTQSAGGEAVAVTTQTAFTADTVLYAHWTRDAASGPNPGTPAGHALNTVESPGVSGVRNSAATGPNPSGLMYANLYRKPDGTFVSVDGNAGESVVVTFWSRDFRQTGQRQLAMELPTFGGFFHGETYNYLVFGQRNEAESNEAEVFRVVKYDHDFNRVSAAAVRDCYTNTPFRAGSCRMAESGNHLTIHTSRLRYLTDDGLHHQSQLSIVVNTDTMEVENDLGAFQGNHVSHSFNQFVLYDGEERVFVDHGDAYPRGVVLHQSNGDSYREVSLLDIPGPTGDNWTGVGVGGLEQSDDYYLVAINTVRQSAVQYAADGSFSHTLDSDERDVMLLSVSKYMDAGSVRQDSLTDYYRSGTTAGVPYLVRLGDNRYVMLWQEFTRGTDQWGYAVYNSQGVRYALLNGNADLLTEPALLSEARLSEYCKPVVDGDSVVWYVDAGGTAEQAGTRTFYRLSFSAPDTPDTPNTPDTPDRLEIHSLTAGDGVVTATLTGTIPAGSKFVAALYNSDGQFVATAIADAVSGQNSVPLAAGDGMTLRAFLLDSNYRPLCVAQ